jgi:hypothetical protein
MRGVLMLLLQNLVIPMIYSGFVVALIETFITILQRKGGVLSFLQQLLAHIPIEAWLDCGVCLHMA